MTCVAAAVEVAAVVGYVSLAIPLVVWAPPARFPLEMGAEGESTSYWATYSRA